MMSRILGNILVVFFICVASCSIYAQGVLRVLDDMGSIVSSVQAGRPFTVELHLSGSGSLDQAPVIEGIDQFDVLDSSWSHSIINGDVSIDYRYSAIAPKPGTYELGPALFSRDGVQEVSNRVELAVGTEPVQHQDAPILVRLSLDKDRAVVGERVVATVRYYYSDPSQRLHNFVEQPTDDITRKKARGPRNGEEEIDSIPYKYIELDWDLYPKKTGEIIIPALAAEYEDRMPYNPMFGGISRMLGMAAAQKRAYSNAMTLQVDSVPSSDQTVQGVGSIDSFELNADPAMVCQAEGAVVTLTLRGNFDPDQIVIEGLQRVPDELRYFESKESSENPTSSDDVAIKQFEYIVQGMKTGNFEIPAQKFHYFDVDSRTHKTISTAPLSMTIMPGVAPKKTKNSLSAPQTRNTLPLATYELHPMAAPVIVPWWLFFLLTSIPFFVWIFKRGQHSYAVHYKKNYRARRASQAFSRAFTQLTSLQKEKKTERLYALFIELFADKWHISIGSISQEYIEKRFKDVGMPDVELEEWSAFFATIAQQAFGAKQINIHNIDLFKKAEQWLHRLQQLL